MKLKVLIKHYFHHLIDKVDEVNLLVSDSISLLKCSVLGQE